MNSLSNFEIIEDILFECVIPGRPGILKNSKKIIVVRGRRIPVPSDRYNLWEKVASLYVYRLRPVTVIDFPVNLQAVFYFKNHAHEPDLSNSYQGIEDILAKQGVLKNDKLIYSHDGSRKVFGEPVERIEIKVTRATC